MLSMHRTLLTKLHSFEDLSNVVRLEVSLSPLTRRLGVWCEDVRSIRGLAHFKLKFFNRLSHGVIDRAVTAQLQVE